MTDDRPVLLDAFCCAGGAAVAHSRAGFRVVGIDIDLQPNYPFEFIQGDALDLIAALLEGYKIGPHDGGYWFHDIAAVHASAPCQSFTAYRRKGHGVGDGYLNLIPQTRDLLGRWSATTGLPWVIENVPGAPLINPIQLCGSSFGLDVRRHRLFESNIYLEDKPCDHASQKPGRFPGATNRKPMSRATVEVGVWRIPLETQKQAMGVDWDVTLRELSEALPPAFTEFIGHQLMEKINA